METLTLAKLPINIPKELSNAQRRQFAVVTTAIVETNLPIAQVDANNLTTLVKNFETRVKYEEKVEFWNAQLDIEVDRQQRICLESNDVKWDPNTDSYKMIMGQLQYWETRLDKVEDKTNKIMTSMGLTLASRAKIVKDMTDSALGRKSIEDKKAEQFLTQLK